MGNFRGNRVHRLEASGIEGENWRKLHWEVHRTQQIDSRINLQINSRLPTSNRPQMFPKISKFLYWTHSWFSTRRSPLFSKFDVYFWFLFIRRHFSLYREEEALQWLSMHHLLIRLRIWVSPSVSLSPS